MGRPIEIEIDAKTQDAERGLDRTADSLEDLSDGLGKAEDAARDADRVIDRDLTQALDDVKRKAKTAGDALGDETRKGTRRAEQATDEFKQEAGANFSEVASSFSGDMDSAIDLVQGTLGGLAGSIPGIGLAAGVAAAGIGAIYATLQGEGERVREQITSMTEDLIESGKTFLTEGYISTELQKIYTGAEDATIKMADLQALASSTGISEAQLARAFAGDQDARAAALQTVVDRYAEVGDKATSSNAVVADAAIEQLGDLGRLRDALEQNESTFVSAQEAQARYLNATNSTTRETQGAITDLRGKFDGLGRTIEELPASKTVTVTADLAQIERQLRNFRPTVTVSGRIGSVVQ
ncbi:hypothetical protein [Actinotalea sp.]|uniref:hypothetical protein n=1 Tax=Actinotalea sp. TaxID=1872145 RepID=UPI003565594B